MHKNITSILLILSATGTLAAAEAPDLTSVKQYLKQSVTDGTVAGGSVLIIHKGKVVYGSGFGYFDRKTKKPFKLDTPVIVASISKPLLATAAFRLVDNKKLSLTEPINTYLPEFNNAKLESGVLLKRSPNMVDLFTHTSGLRNDNASGGRPWFAKWTSGKPLSEVVKGFAKSYPFKANPGTRYAYSGIGTDVAARVLEVTTGKPRNTLLVDELSSPLGMEKTHYWDVTSVAKVGPMPTRYYRGDKEKLLESRKYKVPAEHTYASSGGTVITTAPDLGRWLMMIRNGGKHEGKRFLSAVILAEMLTPQKGSKNVKGGLFVRRKDDKSKVLSLGHTGSSGTNCWIDFEHDLIGVMLTQTRGKDIKPFRIELEKRITASVTQMKENTKQEMK